VGLLDYARVCSKPIIFSISMCILHMPRMDYNVGLTVLGDRYSLIGKTKCRCAQNLLLLDASAGTTSYLIFIIACAEASLLLVKCFQAFEGFN
jgi:hypothetical protein